VHQGVERAFVAGLKHPERSSLISKANEKITPAAPKRPAIARERAVY